MGKQKKDGSKRLVGTGRIVDGEVKFTPTSEFPRGKRHKTEQGRPKGNKQSWNDDTLGGYGDGPI